MTTYRLIDCPTNGTTGQDCGRFSLSELPPRVQAAINAAPDQSEWRLPALSEGDSGDELTGLETVARRCDKIGR